MKPSPLEKIRSLLGAKQVDAAWALILDALAVSPGDAALWRLRAICDRYRQSEGTASVLAIRRSVLLNPGHAGSWAECCISEAATPEPDRAARGRLDRYLTRALITDPTDDRICQLALRLRSGSQAVLRLLVGNRPDIAAHHAAAGQRAEADATISAARDAFRRALCLDPTHVSTIRRLNRNPLDPAAAVERLAWLRQLTSLSDAETVAWLEATGSQPTLLAKEGDAAYFIDRQLKAIRAVEAAQAAKPAPKSAGPIYTFTSAYWEADNTTLLRAAGRVNVRHFQHHYGEAATRSTGGGAVSPVSRSVGIVTSFAFTHSVWEALCRDWVDMLRSAGCPVTLYDVYGLAGTQAQNSFQAVVSGPLSTDEWIRTLLEGRHSILLYPEIGMDPTTMTLASLRLAPLQVASWGHPTTSGLPTIDRYLSADRFETYDGDAHYVETLVRLPGVGARVRPKSPPAIPLAPADLQIGPGEVAFVLAQSIFKYTPAFDAILAEIAASSPNVRFYVFSAGTKETIDFWRRRVAQRFAGRGLVAARFFRLLPRLSVEDFHRVLATADGYLDPIGFSGFNTGLSAIRAGCPLVTLEGPRLRHRLAAGLLREASATDTIASSRADYIRIACRLAEDTGFREQARTAQSLGLTALTRAGDGQDGRHDLTTDFLNALDLT